MNLSYRRSQLLHGKVKKKESTNVAHSTVDLLKATRAVTVCKGQPSATILTTDNKKGTSGTVHLCFCVYSMCVHDLSVNTEGYLVSVLGLCLCRDPLWKLRNLIIMAACYPVQDLADTISSTCCQITESTSDSDCAVAAKIQSRRWQNHKVKLDKLYPISRCQSRLSWGQAHFSFDAEWGNNTSALVMSSNMMSSGFWWQMVKILPQPSQRGWLCYMCPSANYCSALHCLSL